MYVDGHLEGEFCQRIKVSALETVQFSAVSVFDDIKKCISMEPKAAKDLVYVLGTTANELGASEYYEMFDKIGANVPFVDFDKFKKMYKALQKAIDNELVSSCHAVARGGLGVHLSYMAMAGGLGIEVDLSKIPIDNAKDRILDDAILFSESAGRFIVTIAKENKQAFEELFKGMAISCIGVITDEHDRLKIFGQDQKIAADLLIEQLEKAFNKTFGDMI